MIVLFALIRAAHVASLMVAFGGGAYAFLIRDKSYALPKAETLRALYAGAAGIALVTAFLSLVLTAGQMTGVWQAALDPLSAGMVVADTFYGHVFLVRLALLLGLCLMSIFKGHPSAQTLPAGAALASLGLTSHAAANGGAYWLVLAGNDALHLLCGGFWIGGLLLLALMMRQRGADFVAALRIFSVWGTYAVACLAIAGTVNALTILRIAPSHWSYTYMTLLTVKILLAVLMIALALANRFALTPRLSGGSKAAQETLGWTVMAELGIGAMVVILAAFLGLLPPGV